MADRSRMLGKKQEWTKPVGPTMGQPKDQKSTLKISRSQWVTATFFTDSLVIILCIIISFLGLANH